MEENTKTAATPDQPVTSNSPPVQTKMRNNVIERVRVKLIGAGSCVIDDMTVKKNEILELDASKSERFLKTGLFKRV